MNDFEQMRAETQAFLLEVPKVRKLFQDDAELEKRKIREGLARIFGFQKNESNSFIKNLEKNGKLTKIIKYPGKVYYKKNTP